MASRSDTDIYLFGDDFEAVLDVLEEDEDLQEKISNAANNVSNIHLNL